MLCECGCGQPTPIAKQTAKRSGWVKGKPLRFIVGHNAKLKERATGYNVVRMPEHPRANKNGYVLEHIVIAERALGRSLPDASEVHHADENKRNNANRNLVICQDTAYHNLLHIRTKVVRAGGDPNAQRYCAGCHRPRPFAEFGKSKTAQDGLRPRCLECTREQHRQWLQNEGRRSA